MNATEPLEINDFSGGMTDFIIGAPKNRAEKIDNFLLSPDRKPYMRPGSELFLEEQCSTTERIHMILLLGGSPLFFSENLVFDHEDGAFVELFGPDGTSPIFPESDNAYYNSATDWQDIIYITNENRPSVQKIYYDGDDELFISNAGLPEIPSGVLVTNPTGSSKNYLYAFCYKYTYTVGEITYTDRGPVYYYPTTVTGGAIGPGVGAAVTLPAALADEENWDAAEFEIEIYRTIDAGTDYFLVAAQDYGDTSYNDETTDAALVLNTPLYTTGGILSNDTPPKCKFVHIVNDTAYYANIVFGEGADNFAVLQSKVGDPDSVPANFIKYTEQPITGLSSIFDRPIVFCTKNIYRIDGVIAADGTGDMQLRRIDDTAGCVANNSIVRTNEGLFWAGNTGFYYTDGFVVRKINTQLPRTYASYVSSEIKAKRIVGTYDSKNKRVFWTVCADLTSDEPSAIAVLDLKFGVTEESCITTLSGGEAFRPSSICYGDNLFRGDSRGFVLLHDDTVFTDPKIDADEAIEDWITQAIIYDYKSPCFDFGSKFMKKWVPWIMVSANNNNVSLQINSSNDIGKVTGELKPIRYNRSIVWGSELPVWGDPSAVWNKIGIIEEKRRFPASGLRCAYKQVQFTNAQALIISSSIFGTVAVDNAGLTATLTGSLEWITQLVDYYIAFANDNYVNRFLIDARVSNKILSFEDPDALCPTSGTYNFRIYGVPKGESFELNAYVLHYMFLGKTFTTYQASQGG